VAARAPAAIAPPPSGASAATAAAAPAETLQLVLPEDLVVAPGVVVPVNREKGAQACDLNGYLRKILTARVYELAVRTALLPPLPPNPCGAATRTSARSRLGERYICPPLGACMRRTERRGASKSASGPADARDTAAPAPWFFAHTQVETPLDPAPRLSERLGGGNTVLLKREDMQPVFSFKARAERAVPERAAVARMLRTP
jgi:hypothetical protein